MFMETHLSSIPKIDAHQHFWQIARGDYSWMTDEEADIRHDILPADLAPIIKAQDIDGTILVQAADTVAETEFLLSLAESTPFIKGVVGWVDLEDARVSDILTHLSQNQWFKGIRPMLQDIEETRWIARPNVVEALNQVSQMGLRLDALITPRHLNVIEEIAQLLPEMPIVIDHCAKPEIAITKEPGTAWRNGMARLAQCPNVMCKISGLANEAAPDWHVDQLKPTVDHVLKVFGPARLMWGSDWPVLNLVGHYERWHTVAEQLFSRLSSDEKTAIFGGTAQRFYGLAQHS
ncbi:MAG: amidohydrolase family protein [Pseudomonadota bacterium]|nr:amidohydrolase family protein [Pseudomonadota bacterium]